MGPKRGRPPTRSGGLDQKKDEAAKPQTTSRRTLGARKAQQIAQPTEDNTLTKPPGRAVKGRTGPTASREKAKVPVKRTKGQAQSSNLRRSTRIKKREDHKQTKQQHIGAQHHESRAHRDIFGSQGSLIEAFLERDTASFKKDVLAELKVLLATAKTISPEALHLQDLGQGVEQLLWRIIDFGYAPLGQIMAPRRKDGGRKANSVPTSIPNQDHVTSSNIITTNSEKTGKSGKEYKIKFNDLGDENKALVLSKYGIQTDRLSEEDNDTVVHNDLGPDDTNYTEKEWQDDMRKCSISNEQVYQCTIMMKAINRHKNTQLNANLDWTLGVKWGSPHPPPPMIETLPQKIAPVQLNAPEPDCSVGFRPRRIFDPGDRELFPLDLLKFVEPENTPSNDDKRAFPFLIMEVKGIGSKVSGRDASFQSMNVGAHALYNMWTIMKQKPGGEETFFKDVRVFTAGGHAKEFWIRVHSAVKSKNFGRPLQYRHQRVIEVAGPDYSQEKVQTLVKAVMYWGVNTLLPKLKKAVKSIVDSEKKKMSQIQQSAGKAPMLETVSEQPSQDTNLEFENTQSTQPNDSQLSQGVTAESMQGSQQDIYSTSTSTAAKRSQPDEGQASSQTGRKRRSRKPPAVSKSSRG